jgi:hypothetical protein
MESFEISKIKKQRIRRNEVEEESYLDDLLEHFDDLIAVEYEDFSFDTLLESNSK